ncbi:chemotaxis protein CheW [Aestuariispira insulae]|uniref:Purine-binding chemotaxis protein CheW n=1 Tax=Aestuariispira insulae TaxID=1461337 RepID=A0A3D9HQ20_9PROT|nr:chemotaxis protein CheW [Aestuariispira insulae]RED51614.1 purine-binding chemotaxis protein CheW [Aestuariispira insulae]
MTSLEMKNGHAQSKQEYVCFTVDQQLMGLPIRQVEDIFIADHPTWVPRARPDVMGVVSLRGQIVTVIDLATRLAMKADEQDNDPDQDHQNIILVTHQNETFGLRVDEIDGVRYAAKNSLEKIPDTMGLGWEKYAKGVHQLDGELLVILKVEPLIADGGQEKA